MNEIKVKINRLNAIRGTIWKETTPDVEIEEIRKLSGDIHHEQKSVVASVSKLKRFSADLFRNTVEFFASVKKHEIFRGIIRKLDEFFRFFSASVFSLLKNCRSEANESKASAQSFRESEEIDHEGFCVASETVNETADSRNHVQHYVVGHTSSSSLHEINETFSPQIHAKGLQSKSVLHRVWNFARHLFSIKPKLSRSALFKILPISKFLRSVLSTISKAVRIVYLLIGKFIHYGKIAESESVSQKVNNQSSFSFDSIGVQTASMWAIIGETISFKHLKKMRKSSVKKNRVRINTRIKTISHAVDSAPSDVAVDEPIFIKVAGAFIQSVFTSAAVENNIVAESEVDANISNISEQSADILAELGFVAENTEAPAHEVMEEIAIETRGGFDMEISPPVDVKIDGRVKIIPLVDGRNSKPSNVSVDVLESVSQSVVCYNQSMKDIRADNASIVTAPVLFSVSSKKPISVISKMLSGCVVALSFDPGTPSEWYDPVQTGSNLYIRSVDSSWQDGEKAYIDLSVFYEPKQEESGLYIRSAYSVWTDGGSANIDTDFFLEPVQEGSDLYIRQNIFD